MDVEEEEEGEVEQEVGQESDPQESLLDQFATGKAMLVEYEHISCCL